MCFRDYHKRGKEGDGFPLLLVFFFLFFKIYQLPLLCPSPPRNTCLFYKTQFEETEVNELHMNRNDVQVSIVNI